MASLPSFPQLTPDARLWRIDWFGEVSYPGSIRRHTQPSIRVAISPLKGSPESVSFSGNVETEVAQQQNVWMPVGSLGMLRIGDIWQDGKLHAQPCYCREIFQNLEVRQSAAKVIKAGLPIDDHYLLPFSEHPWHRLHTDSYCIAARVSDDVMLIIPGAEMIRFYFGSCSILLHHLFTKPFSEERLSREKHYDANRRHLHLKLADGIPRFAVPDIARIATDNYARQAAASIYAHCLKATANGEKAYPYMTFPFHGKTTLHVVGMWLPFADQPKRTFLAFQLRSCSHPFAFDSLTYDPCERADWKKDGQSEVQNRADRNRAYGSPKKPESVLNDADPGAKKKLRHFLFDDLMRFPDLRHKPVRPRELVIGDARQVLMKHPDGTLERVSFGNSEGSNEAHAINVCLGQPVGKATPAKDKLPAFVTTGMAEAQSAEERRKGVIAKPLLPFGETHPVFPLPMIVDEDGVIDPVSLFTEPDGHLRTRRGCFVGLFDAETEVRKVVIIEGAQYGYHPQVKKISNTDIGDLAAKIDWFTPYLEEQSSVPPLRVPRRRRRP